MNSEKFQIIRNKNLLTYVFSIDFLILLLWIPCVIFIFKFIEDRRFAGFIAGVGFLLIPIMNIYRELKGSTPTTFKTVKVFASATFLLLSALPIFMLRLLNWNKNLEDISILNMITGRELHLASNFLYIAMLIVIFISNCLVYKNRRKEA